VAIHITSGVTVGNTVSTITFANWYHNIEIVNRSSTDMWVRVDGVDPTVGGDECFFVPAQSFIDVVNGKLPPEPALGLTSNTIVKLITATAANFTLQAGV
jgi:hypothetical protein